MEEKLYPENYEWLPDDIEALPDDFSFFDEVASIARISRGNDNLKHETESFDLSNLTPDDYETPGSTASRIAELNKIMAIIHSLENRSTELPPVKLEPGLKINYAAELNPSQLAAVTTTEGQLLIIAGAGSGKTRVVTYRVAYLLERGVSPGEIVVLTFTRKAAKEMLGRVQKLLQGSSTDKVVGGTFHSFAVQTLRKYHAIIGIPPNFNVLDNKDSEDCVDVVRTQYKKETDKAFPKKQRIWEIISSSRNRNIPIDEVIKKEFTGLVKFIPDIQQIAEGYQLFKTNSQSLDFDDLLFNLRDYLANNEEFKKRLTTEFRYVLVDEYQDTNQVQREIVELLASTHRNVMVVGDDAQSIYGFRGANIMNILEFPQTYPDAKLYKLQENYRSIQNILSFTNQITDNARFGYKKQLFSNQISDIKPIVRRFYDEHSQAEFIVSKILELREQSVELDKIAILVRAAWHAKLIEVELNSRKIPYLMVGGFSFLERKHVRDILAYLRIVLNPFDVISWHRILNYIPKIGKKISMEIITKITTEKRLKPDWYLGKKYYEGIKDLTKTLVEARKKTNGVPQKIEILKNYYMQFLQFEDDFQLRVSDIDAMIELASHYEELDKFISDLTLDPPSKKFQEEVKPLTNEEEDKRLVISTIHSAKGLEWHTVFIPHALDGLIPDARALKDLFDLEEERRLFYVACTRAEQNLFITIPGYVNTYKAFMSKPSRFLTEIDKNLFDYDIMG